MHAEEIWSGVGVGAEAVGDKLSESFDGSAPNVGLSGGGISSGGGAKRTGKASAFVPPEGLAQNPLIWAGIACGLLAAARVGRANLPDDIAARATFRGVA